MTKAKSIARICNCSLPVGVRLDPDVVILGNTSLEFCLATKYINAIGMGKETDTVEKIEIQNFDSKIGTERCRK